MRRLPFLSLGTGLDENPVLAMGTAANTEVATISTPDSEQQTVARFALRN